MPIGNKFATNARLLVSLAFLISSCNPIARTSQNMNHFKITGSVVNMDDLPIAEATVYIETATVSHPDIGALTNDNGYFDFLDLRPGKYSIAVSKEGFEKLSKQVIIKDENVDLKFVLNYAD